MASCLPLQLPSQSPLHAAHDTSSCTKFAGRTSQIDAALLIANLNANNIKLLLCTIDHTLVAWVTFCTASCTAPTLPTPATFPIPPKPPWLVPNDFPHSPAFFCVSPLSPRSPFTPSSCLSCVARSNQKNPPIWVFPLYCLSRSVGNTTTFPQHFISTYYSFINRPFRHPSFPSSPLHPSGSFLSFTVYPSLFFQYHINP